MDVSHPLECLNPAQREAVTAEPTHCLAPAGAGADTIGVIDHALVR